jgi:hypothetical protein
MWLRKFVAGKLTGFPPTPGELPSRSTSAPGLDTFKRESTDNQAHMETVYFILVGIALYFAADWVLNRIERARGARFEHRDLIYFAIILVLAISAFYLINRFGSGSG